MNNFRKRVENLIDNYFEDTPKKGEKLKKILFSGNQVKI